jgi:DNA-binding MarR family transcriptional regulator
MDSQARTALPIQDQAFIVIQKTADALAQEVEQFLKRSGLTSTQYNVLRILRGAGPEGLACSSIGEKMISHDPDMTRLLDRMQKRGLITRHRQSNDRRVVKTRITSRGLALLKRLDRPVHKLHKQQFQGVNPQRLKTLLESLEQVRKREPIGVMR